MKTLTPKTYLGNPSTKDTLGETLTPKTPYGNTSRKETLGETLKPKGNPSTRHIKGILTPDTLG